MSELETTSYLAAIRQSLGDVMAADESVFICGEDVRWHLWRCL